MPINHPNTVEYYTQEFDRLRQLLEDDKLEECIEGARALLVEGLVPRYHRIKTLVLLATATDDWEVSYLCRDQAESLWALSRSAYRLGVDPVDDAVLADLRLTIDSLNKVLEEERLFRVAEEMDGMELDSEYTESEEGESEDTESEDMGSEDMESEAEEIAPSPARSKGDETKMMDAQVKSSESDVAGPSEPRRLDVTKDAHLRTLPVPPSLSRTYDVIDDGSHCAEMPFVERDVSLPLRRKKSFLSQNWRESR